LGTAEALPLVREAAQNGETISVRMSAIGALGQLGGPEDISFLNSVLTGTEDRLKLPAQWALNQIQQR
jgi:HEAT repeat protein